VKPRIQSFGGLDNALDIPDLSGMANPSAVSALPVQKSPRSVRIIGGVHVEGETFSVVSAEGKGAGKGYTIKLEEYGVAIFKANAADTLIPWGRVGSVDYAAGE
jgi:hypothetical protein